MIELELRTLLEEHDIINIPDRCVSCVRLGALAASLSQEHEPVVSIKAHDMDILFEGFVKAAVKESLVKQYPNDTDEEIGARAQNGLERALESGVLSEELMNLGALLGSHMSKRGAIVDQIKTLLETCPPEGHSQTTA